MKNIIRILERFLLNLKDFPKNLKYYFKNIIKWSPILWKDRDWDHYFIYEALRFRGYNPECRKIEGVLNYFELHIEQGRILEDDVVLNMANKIEEVTGFKGNWRDKDV